MRNLCLFICISLLSSIFHAVAMPIETAHPSVAKAVAVHEAHGCDEEAPASASGKPCQLSGHICCVGLTATTACSVCAHVSATADLNPIFQVLVLQDRPNPHFKPPKHPL